MAAAASSCRRLGAGTLLGCHGNFEVSMAAQNNTTLTSTAIQRHFTRSGPTGSFAGLPLK